MSLEFYLPSKNIIEFLEYFIGTGKTARLLKPKWPHGHMDIYFDRHDEWISDERQISLFVVGESDQTMYTGS
jgi:hypothetical protein